MNAYIDGLSRLELKLDKLAAADTHRFLALAGAMVEGDAKNLCPVDDGVLRNSITYEVDDEK